MSCTHMLSDIAGGTIIPHIVAVLCTAIENQVENNKKLHTEGNSVFIFLLSSSGEFSYIIVTMRYNYTCHNELGKYVNW